MGSVRNGAGEEDRHWAVFAAGSTVRLEFAEGQVGELQRTLVLLTRRSSSPAPFRTFANVLISKWPVILELLSTPAEKLRETWTAVLSQLLSQPLHSTPQVLRPVQALRGQRGH